LFENEVGSLMERGEPMHISRRKKGKSRIRRAGEDQAARVTAFAGAMMRLEGASRSAMAQHQNEALALKV
jgi:hypothetical protein